MIRGIRRRFIRIALAVLAVAMVLVTCIVNVANWINVRQELWETMELLEGKASSGKRGEHSRHMKNTLDESRYFTVSVSDDGTWTLQDSSRIRSVDAEELQSVVAESIESGKDSGFCGDYLFSAQEQKGGRVMLFLNCETRLTSVRRLTLISIIACASCILLAGLLVALFSSRAIRPLAENAVAQKQFITDAGHELKTPLTVISANMDVLALETGDNEWIHSTQKQVANMRGLVNELIYLSRLDEEDARLKREEFDLSELADETAEPFQGMAEYSGKRFSGDIAPDVRVTGDRDACGRLISILCDNAVKYAPDGDTIRLRLERAGRGACLTVENSLQKPLDEETLRRLFDRFYRADASRSRTTGGYGIGLSIARAIAERQGGSLKAEQTADERLRFIWMIKNT